MKRFWGFALAIAIFGTLAIPKKATAISTKAAAGADQKNSEQTRSLTGQVLSRNDAPLSGAVVYLKNTKTLAVKSFISENDGGYRFHSLSPNVDYEVWAEYQGVRSATKTVSAFDSRSQVTLNIHIDMQK